MDGSAGQSPAVLESVGISRLEEELYLVLLDRPGVALPQLRDAWTGTPARFRSAVRNLETLGLLSRSPTKPARYYPASPETIIEVLVLRRQEELERTRLAAADLEKRFRIGSQGADPLELVEVIVGRDTIARRTEQLQQAARSEVLAFDKPPYVQLEGNPIETELLSAGVRYRVVYDQTALEYPGILEEIREFSSVGEDSRVLSGLPMKLDVYDRRVAIMPLDPDRGYEGVLLVRSPTIVSALVLLFEGLWQRAVPIRFDGRQKASLPASDEWGILPDAELLELIGLMAAGLKDQAIARHLGVGSRTMERRLRRCMDMFGVNTRFQMGLVVGEQGLLRNTERP